MRSHELARRVLSALVAVILATGGWLGAVRPAYAVTRSFSFNLSGDMLPDPFGDIVQELGDLKNVSVSGTQTDNGDGSGKVDFTLDVTVIDSAKLNDTDGVNDGHLKTQATVNWNSNKKVTSVQVGGGGSVKLQLLKAQKLVKLSKISSKLGGFEVDAGVYLYIDANGAGTLTGSDASTLSFAIGAGAELADVRVGTFHLKDYASGSLKGMFEIEYTPAANSWKVTFKPSYKVKLIKVDDEYLLDWEQEWKWTIYDGSAAKTGHIDDTMGGTISVVERDGNVDGDAPGDKASARDLGTVSYLQRGGLINGLSDADWYKVTVASPGKSFRVAMQPTTGGDLGLYAETDTGVTQYSINTGAGVAEQVTFTGSEYTSAIYFKVYRTSAQVGQYHLDLGYNQTAQAVQVSVAQSSGRQVSARLQKQGGGYDVTQTIPAGKTSTIFLDVPYGAYTASATEDTTSYSGSATVDVNSLLASFVVALSSYNPTSYYDGGTGITNKLIQSDDSPNCGSTAAKGWVKVTSNGETISIRLRSVNATAQARFYVNNNGSTDDLVLTEGGSAKYGSMKLYVNSVFYGTQCYGAKVTLGYEGYAPLTPLVPTGPSQVNDGDTAVYTVKSVDKEGNQVKYAFDWNGDGTTDETTALWNSGQEVSMTHVWAVQGGKSYTVKVKAIDSTGLESAWSSGLTVVVNALPVAKFSISPNPAKVGQTVSFTDQSADSDGSIKTWKWAFGDGATSTSQSPTHAYTAAGTYNIYLTVTDDKGASHTAFGSAVMDDPPSTSVRGDANKNGKLDTGDATLILRNIVNLPIDATYLPLLPRVDMNCNDRVDTGDATIVLRLIVGLPVPQCWETIRTLRVNP